MHSYIYVLFPSRDDKLLPVLAPSPFQYVSILRLVTALCELLVGWSFPCLLGLRAGKGLGRDLRNSNLAHVELST